MFSWNVFDGTRLINVVLRAYSEPRHRNSGVNSETPQCTSSLYNDLVYHNHRSNNNDSRTDNYNENEVILVSLSGEICLRDVCTDEGMWVGEAVGSIVGVSVGVSVGLFVGAAVGVDVGSEMIGNTRNLRYLK